MVLEAIKMEHAIAAPFAGRIVMFGAIVGDVHERIGFAVVVGSAWSVRSETIIWESDLT